MSLRYNLLHLQLAPEDAARWQDLFERLRAYPDDPEALAALLALGERYREQLDAWIEISRVADPDFGLKWEDGIDILLPHLGSARSGARLLVMDATANLAAGDVNKAATELAAALRLAQQVQTEPLTLSALVSLAIVGSTTENGSLVLDGSLLSPDARAELEQALDFFEGPDPFALQAALRNEIRLIDTTLQLRLDTWRDPIALEVELTQWSALPPEVVAAFSDRLHADGQYEANLAREQALYEQYINEAAEALASADAPARIADLEQAVQEGRYGTLVKVFTTPLSKIHGYQQRGTDAVRLLREALKGSAPAPAAP